MKISVYIATSLDGFIARCDGAIDWLGQASALVPEGEDCGFKAFMDSVDIVYPHRLVRWRELLAVFSTTDGH